MRHQVSTIIGKGVQFVARLRGGGSALPGLVVEKIDSNFVPRALASLPLGVVIVSGTNGKTTTTKMVVELLESQGLHVFTNRTGSNFIRGVAAAILRESNKGGKLRSDIAVLELDEAHAVHFASKVAPRYALFLNVMRDQLDRFGEIDYTAALLHRVARATTDTIVINRDDPRLTSAEFTSDISAKISTYGVGESLKSLFPSDDTLRGSTQDTVEPTLWPDDIELTSVEDAEMVITYAGKPRRLSMKLKGVYNMQNAAGALALTRVIMGDKLDEQAMLRSLSMVTPAFGRGEDIIVDGTSCELVLVKNPAGFRLSLASFDARDHATMIAINDDYADGRDMSWLWDVEFDSIERVATVSGVRGYDMALRLQYDEVPVDYVDTDLVSALDHFLTTNKSMPKRIYCTYTAMLTLRKALGTHAKVERFL